MQRLLRVGAATVVAGSAGLLLAPTATAAPLAVQPTPCLFGVQAYPPGSATCTYGFVIGGFSFSLVTAPDSVTFNVAISGLGSAKLQIFVNGFSFFVTPDAQGNAVASIPKSALPEGKQTVTVEADGAAPVSKVVDVPAASVIEAASAAAPAETVGDPAAVPSTSADATFAAVDAKSLTVPASDKTGEYALLGGIVLAGAATTATFAVRRRKS